MRTDVVDNKTTRVIIDSVLPRAMAVRMPTGKRDQAWLQNAEASRSALSELWDAFRRIRRSSRRSQGLPEEPIDVGQATLSFDTSNDRRNAL